MPEATRFGKYLLFERIAVGGMAEVFRAKAVGSDNLLALKRIHPHHLENSDFVSMLIDEAKISVQLNHPNVVQVVDLGRVDSHYFIAMEFIPGRDVRRMMERLTERGRTLPLEHAVAIVASVARGLDYAHRKTDGRGNKMEIIHRDISPQNVLVGFDGNVKVIDFGIAKAAGRLMETQVGILKGKYAYMSPEQAGGGTLDHRTDIFSAGIMLYECAVGKHPFRATHDIETLRNIKNSTMIPPHLANPSIPSSVEKVILQALSSLREDRYSNAGDMADDLEAALEGIHPGYHAEDLARYITDLFSDEISAGGFPEVAVPGDRTQPQQAGSSRLDRIAAGNSLSGTLSKSSDLVAPRQKERNRDSGGGAGVRSWAQRRDEFNRFLARVQEGKLTRGDSTVLGVLTAVFVALALLLLLWEPPRKPSPQHRGARPMPVRAAGSDVKANPATAGTPSEPSAAVTAVPTATAISAEPVQPKGTVQVTSIPSGAEVRVGGTKMGVTPLDLELEEGDYSLLVRDRSGVEESRAIHVRANATARESFKLQ